MSGFDQFATIGTAVINSEAELANLIAAADQDCDSKSRKISANSGAATDVGAQVEAKTLK